MLFWRGGDLPPAQTRHWRDGAQRPDPRLAGDGRSRRRPPDLARHLVDRGLISPAQMLLARARMARDRVDLADIALTEGWTTAADLMQARAEGFHLRRVDLALSPPDPDLMALLDPATCLRLELLPWRLEGDKPSLATSRPETFQAACADLPAPFHEARPVLVSPADLQAAVARHWHAPMTAAASARVAAQESCRTWGRAPLRRGLALGLVVLALLALVLLWPAKVFAALALWAGATLVVAVVHKSASVAAHLLSGSPPDPLPPAAAPQARRRPRVSILVPLFREREVASTLVRRLEELSYPKALLDIVLILEETDSLTRTALEEADLPPWMRVLVVPDGQPRTKPRAMNYALDFCRGEIVGIYDAEDAPEPDQIDRVVARFATAPPDLVCLQGVLDYYNPRQNWLARCFTIEYATWFRVMMPGMSRLGFAIPLGGTTLFFRRSALERLGGWDAHNVTEDADLGFRLARHGYRTEMIATTTHEEANCHLLPWVRQRSRWLKGYMVTYLVHMRAPRLLLRQLGPWRFLGFQTHFITALSQFLLAPVLWSFWLIPLGLPHPLDGVLPAPLLTGFAVGFLLVEALSIAVGMLAVSGPAHRHLLFWVPTLHFYFPLGVLAAYKALFELIFAPFYWDKTRHGHSLMPAEEEPPIPGVTEGAT